MIFYIEIIFTENVIMKCFGKVLLYFECKYIVIEVNYSFINANFGMHLHAY